MNIFDFEDYKAAIKFKIKALKTEGNAINLKQLSEKLGLQYTYFSKVLNSSSSHFSESYVFEIGKILKLEPDEIDYLQLLRSLANADSPDHRRYLMGKISSFRRETHLDAEVQPAHAKNTGDEMQYLFNPLSLVVHASLRLPGISEHPRRLCSILGISSEMLDSILKNLARLGFVELDERKNVIRVLKGRMHYAPNHPLMRAHQQIFLQLCQTQWLRVDEEKRQRFLVTVAADADTFQFLQQRLHSALKEAEKKVSTAKATTVYQLNLETFQWF